MQIMNMQGVSCIDLHKRKQLCRLLQADMLAEDNAALKAGIAKPWYGCHTTCRFTNRDDRVMLTQQLISHQDEAA